MNYKQLSIPERLGFIKDAIMVVQSDAVLTEAFADVGYSADRLSEGLGLEDAARAFWMTQQVEYGTRIEATGEVNAKYRQVVRVLRKDRAFAKLVLEEVPGLFEKLRLNEQTETIRDRLVLQAQHFYSEAMKQPDVLDRFADVSLTADVLQARLAEVNVLNQAIQAQQRQTGQAIAMTSQRRAAMTRLDDWALQFITIARAVLKNDPGQLEKLGVPIR
ncbi:MAG: hypothetical protein KTR29_20270 [Rhodothermaceae bacterium]|nr:hypothetical protein [Rhodothermaceae bacterium]